MSEAVWILKYKRVTGNSPCMQLYQDTQVYYRISWSTVKHITAEQQQKHKFEVCKIQQK